MVTSSEKQIVEDILSLPNAPIILKRVNDKLEIEKQKREKFYNEISEYEKAEFINGEIIIHSPVKKEHNDVSGALFFLIRAYTLKNDLGYVGYEKVMISLSRNDYEPDICFFGEEKSNHFKKGQSLFPAPDLVVEVLSKKTAKNDREIKFDDYRAHGVAEYWIIDPEKELLEQYRLDKNGEYELVLKANSGQLNCQPITGFSINISSIFDSEQNLLELQRILG